MTVAERRWQCIALVTNREQERAAAGNGIVEKLHRESDAFEAARELFAQVAVKLAGTLGILAFGTAGDPARKIVEQAAGIEGAAGALDRFGAR